VSERIERSGCRFRVKSIDGKLQIEMELFHATVPKLASVNLSFEVLRGVKPEQAGSVLI